MINSLEKLYEGDDLTEAALDLMFLRSPGGTIKAAYLYVGGNVSAEAVFNLTKNGAALWTVDDRLIIEADSDTTSKIDLNIETTRGDVLMLDFEECPESGVTAPIALILDIEDGEEGTGGDSLDFSMLTEKTILADDDEILISDSAASGEKKKSKLSAVWSTFLTELDALKDALIGDFEDVYTAIGGKVTKNADITGATKTKVTYDSKGLILSGSDVTATDIGLSDVSNHAQLKRAANDFSTFTEKTVLHADDLIIIEDSEASGVKKKVKKSNLGSSGLQSRADVGVTTSSLANGASTTGTIALGKSFVVVKVVSSVNARIRLYSTAAARTADASREFTAKPSQETSHGLILDLLLDGTTGLTWICSPICLGANADSSPVNNVYYSIQNNSGAASAVTATFTKIEVEA